MRSKGSRAGFAAAAGDAPAATKPARNAIKKLENQRDQALEEILTEEQRTKLKRLRSDN